MCSQACTGLPFFNVPPSNEISIGALSPQRRNIFAEQRTCVFPRPHFLSHPMTASTDLNTGFSLSNDANVIVTSPDQPPRSGGIQPAEASGCLNGTAAKNRLSRRPRTTRALIEVGLSWTSCKLGR